MMLRSDNPKPMTINKITEMLIYVAVSFIITFLITI
jgi:hypothetical protein